MSAVPYYSPPAWRRAFFALLELEQGEEIPTRAVENLTGLHYIPHVPPIETPEPKKT